MGETVTIGDTQMTVANPRIMKAVISRGAHTRVVSHAGQFVVVDLTINGMAPEQPVDRALQSATNGTAVPGSDPLSTVKAPNRYAFPFPAKRHNQAAIQWSPSETAIYWTLPSAGRDSLASDPTFVVDDIHMSRHDGQRLLELTVTNEGNRDGRFKGQLSFQGFSGSSIVTLAVPAGTTRTYTGRPDPILDYFENHGGRTLTLRYPTNDGLASVTRSVEQPPTTTETTN